MVIPKTAHEQCCSHDGGWWTKLDLEPTTKIGLATTQHNTAVL